MPAAWEVTRDECLARRRDAIPTASLLPEAVLKTVPRDRSTVVDTSGHFTDAEIALLNTPARQIVANIRDKVWSAVEVTRAFCKSAAVAQQLVSVQIPKDLQVLQTNCLTEVFFDEAIQRATSLDDYQRKHNRTVGPLHGLPISLKDSFFLPGHPSSIGIIKIVREPVNSTAALAKLMYDLGAVFYVKTNIPVGMAGCETDNNIWGESANPWGFSPGGSSGGEGALVSMKGSPLGIGTDLGGSVRIPAGWCGLYGFKASALRMSMRGHATARPGADFIKSTCGPLSRSLDTVEFWLETVTSHPSLWDLDCKVIPMTWRSQDDHYKDRKLRIGVIRETDGLSTVHPPVARAVNEVVAALEAAGHEVFDWAPTGHRELNDVFFEIAKYHTAPLIREITESGEPIHPMLAHFKPHQDGEADPFNSQIQRELSKRRDQLCDEYFDRWAATATESAPEMDAILTPLSPWAMPRLKTFDRLMSLSWTLFANVLDAPSVVFPVTHADKNVDKKRTSFTPIDDMDAKIQADYDPEVYDGVPVCVQLTGKRLRDEQLLAVTKKVDSLLKAKRA